MSKPVYKMRKTIQGHSYAATIYERRGGLYYTLLYHDYRRPRRVYEMYHTPLLKVAQEAVMICGPRGLARS